MPYCDTTGAAPACKINPASVIVCPSVDDTACLKNTCQAKSGACVPQPVAPATPCDDGDVCTAGDVCKLGQCAPGTFVCECQQDADCVAKDDGDACNGVLFCDKSGAAKGAKPACKPLPNSQIFCPKGDDTACLKNQCDPKSAKCNLQPVKPGTPCDDDKACTVGEVCDAGDCKNGKDNPCDDGDLCTVDSCDAKLGCQHKAKACTDGNDCTVEACDAKTGNCSAPKAAEGGTLCNGDDKGCTVGDSCDGAGTCVIGGQVTCKQPTDPCKEAICQDKGGTDYACVEATRPDNSSCDDAAACRVGALCKAGECLAATKDTLYTSLDLTPSGASMELYGVAPGPGRDFYVGGRWRANKNASTSNNKGFVWRVDVLGKPVWKKEIAGYAQAFTGVVQLAAAPKDGVVAAARVRVDNSSSGANLSVARIVRYDSAGAELFSTDIDVLPGKRSVYPLSVAVDTSGLTVVALQEQHQGGCSLGLCTDLRLALLSTSGEVTSLDPVKAEVATSQRFEDGQVAFRDSDTIVVGGVRSHVLGSARVYAPFDMIVSASGKVIKEPFYGKAGKSSRSFAIPVPTSDAYVSLMRMMADDDKSSAELQVALYDKLGAAENVYLHALTPRLERAKAALKGAIVVGGSLFDQGAQDTFVGIFDKRGNQTLGVRLGSGVFPEGVGDIAWTADERILVARRVVQGSASRGVVARLAVSGHGACDAAGVCVDKGFGACDDGKVCTMDGCNASVGCQHTLSDAVVCDVTNGCSVAAIGSAGECKPLEIGDIRTLADGPLSKEPAVLGPHTDSFVAPDGAGLFEVAGGHANVNVYHVSPDMVGAEIQPAAKARPGSGLPQLELDLRVAPPEDSKGKLGDDVMVWGTDNLSGKYQAVFARRGSQNWVYKQCLNNSCQSWGRKMVEAKNGETWTFARRRVNNVYSIQAVRLKSNGAGSPGGNVFNLSLTSDKLDQFIDARARGDGGVFTAWQRGEGAKGPYGVVAANHYNASTAWTRTINPSDPLLLAAIAPDATGGVFVVGNTIDPNSNLRSGYITRLSSTGQPLWISLANLADERQLTAALPLVDRVLVAGGTYATKTGTWSAFLGAIDYTGSWQWERNFGAATQPWSGIYERSDGGIALAWINRPDPKGPERVSIARTNAWGHVDCLAAGVCSDKATDDCDDGNACTIDVCDAKAGCTHTKTSGGVCATGKVCKSGSCQVP